MKKRMSGLTIILSILSIILIFQAFSYYNNQKEKRAECLEIPAGESFIPCYTFSYIFFDRWINWSVFSLIFIFLMIISWKFDTLKRG